MRAVRRLHGFGNTLNLLAMLNGAAIGGANWTLVTRRAWTLSLSALAWDVQVVHEWSGPCFDLDAATQRLKPQRDRLAEFSDLLGLGSVTPFVLPVPAAWVQATAHTRGRVVIAPEAGHPARQWPNENIEKLVQTLGPKWCVLVGTRQGAPMGEVTDLRGRTSLEQLFGVVANARAVVTMDSGVLHVARWTGTPTVALFGPVDPRYRILKTDRVHALQAELPCCPCNKRETCEGRYDCMRSISVDTVARAVAGVTDLLASVFERVPLV